MLNRFSDLVTRLPLSSEGPKSDSYRLHCIKMDAQHRKKSHSISVAGVGCRGCKARAHAANICNFPLEPVPAVASDRESDSLHSCLFHHEPRFDTKYQVYGRRRLWCLLQPTRSIIWLRRFSATFLYLRVPQSVGLSGAGDRVHQPLPSGIRLFCFTQSAYAV